MIGRKTINIIKIATLSIMIVLFGCSSPLMDIIKEEVEIVVTPPSISSFYPDPDATDIPITSALSMTFSKQIDRTSISSSSIIITSSDETVLNGSFNLSDSGDTITFTPTNNMSFEEVYTVRITSSLKDADGNAVSEEFNWSFTTGFAPDTEAPVLTSVEINYGDTWTNSLALNLDIVATDNRGIAQINISTTNTFSDSNWTTYSDSITYEIPVSDGLRSVYVKVKDGSDNSSSNTVTDSINIDTTKPVANISVNGGNSATNSTSILLGISSQDEDGGSGSYQYRLRLEGDPWPAWTDLVDENAQNIAATVAVSIGNIQYIEGQVTDNAGNESDISIGSILYENSPPVVTETAPTGSSVPGNTTVASVIFNEEMNPLTIDTTKLYIEDTLGNPLPGSLTFYENNLKPYSKVEITGLLLEQFKTYFIVVDALVEDIAGNAIAEEKRFSFETSSAVDNTPPEVSINIDSLNTPPGSETFTTLANGLDATNYKNIVLGITATDDYNGIMDMKIWEVTQTEPVVYTNYSLTYNMDIDPGLDGAGIKYIHYKFRDWALNEVAGYVQIVLDVDVPTVSFQIDNGATHSTNTDGDEAGTLGQVRLDITATDVLPGGVKLTGVTHIVYSETEADVLTPAPEDWISYEETVEQFLLSATNGSKTIYLKVKDYLGLESTVAQQTIIWDTEPPVIIIDELDYLEVNTATTQNGTIADNTDGSPTIAWIKESGPGNISFSNTAIANPDVSADADGDYDIKVTVTDAAGHVSTDIIPFKWDQTEPADIPSMSTPVYNNDGQPQWTWNASTDADFYRLSFSADMSSSWDIDDLNITSWAPTTALTDGDHTLYIEARDNAGNSSNTASNATVKVDTIAPVISNDGQVFLTNTASQITVDYTGVDGAITETGSGISSVLWENTGSGTITFSNEINLNTNITTAVSAGTREVFDIQLTVIDNAGNSEFAAFTIDWDKEAPAAPSIDGIGYDSATGKYHTPDITPTWYWESNGGAGWYQYRLDSGSWSAETQNSSYTPGSLSEGTNEATYTHILYVRERDEAGNWSNDVSLGIWVDASFVSAPSLTVDAPTVTNDTTFRWSWTSGAAGAGAGNSYRFTTTNWSTYANPSGSTGDVVLFYDFDASSQTAQTTVSYTFRVEENHVNWTGKIASNTVTVDLQGPTAPNVSVIANTNDTTPTWTWSTYGSSDGTGLFRYQLDSNGWSGNTTQTAYTPSSQSEGSHTLYVQEQDPLGNWSLSRSAVVNIDLTPPTLNSVTINGGNPYTNTRTNLTLSISATSESGMTMSILDYDPVSAWEPFETFSSSKTVSVPAGEGTKYVYVRLKDAVGNICSYKYDTIILDTTAPTGYSITLNNGEYYTPSKDAYFNAASSDNYSPAADIDVQHAYYTGSGYYVSSWEPIGTNLNFDTYFTNAVGTKYVYARFRDGAGNVTTSASDPSGGGWVYDTVYMYIASMRYAYKGYYNNGLVNVYYNEITDPGGAYVNRYYIYSTLDRNANPNVSTSGFTYEGYADQAASSYKQVSVPTGELRYFWVRAYNADTGGYGYFSSTGVQGFSSHVTVIYDDDETLDIQIAQYIKALLENTYLSGGILGHTSGAISGSMPSYSVTLLPEDDINNSSYSTYYRIYGDPVIVTPGASFSRTSSTYDIRIRNIVSNGRGLIAMGYYGGSILDRIEDNWNAWGLSGTAPTQIGMGESMGLGSNVSSKTRSASTSESIWYSPLRNNYLNTNYQNSNVTLTIFYSPVSGNVYRNGVYLPNMPFPFPPNFPIPVTDGFIYAGDPNYPNHYPVVRQGRFLQFGYRDVPGRGYTGSMTYQYGQVFFINLIARMDNY